MNLKSLTEELEEGLDLRALAEAALDTRIERLIERVRNELNEQKHRILDRIFGVRA